MSTPEERTKRMKELGRRLTVWKTKVMMRHAEAPTPVADCRRCRGSGLTHFCLMPHPDTPDPRLHPEEDECLHPSAVELVEYNDLRHQAAIIIGEAIIARMPALDFLKPFAPTPTPTLDTEAKPRSSEELLRSYGIPLRAPYPRPMVVPVEDDPPKKPKDKP